MFANVDKICKRSFVTNGQSFRFFISGFKKKMKHGNALSKNTDCFRCAIDMQIREANVHSECSGGR